ncbi:flagellin A [Bartonella bovis 91-4]|uniref:Flagellin n=2 Tax=Bartonella bovis TaxID=155194 RepID=N6UFG7_9HYPH|nr:flagellin [Bartonella bovis]ENN91274.1 flagellin A [Bartonella bovis 91-4]
MGSSILTNRSAMTALQTLRSVDANLDKSKDRISTGLRISSAADNTAYWSISSMMKHDSNSMSAIVDAINLGKEQVSIAATAVDLTKEALDDMQKSMVTTHEKDSSDIAKLQDSMKANMTNISNAVQSASFGGKNMLSNGGQTVSVAAGYRREGTAVYVDMIEVGGPELNFGVLGEDGTIDMSKSVLQNIFKTGTTTKFDEAVKNFDKAEETYRKLEADVAEAKAALAANPGGKEEQQALTKAQQALTAGEKPWSEAKAAFKKVTDEISVADFTEMFGVSELSSEAQRILLGSLHNTVRDAVENTLTAGAKIGAAVNLVNIQLDFVKRLLDNVDAGIGSMIDADMNAESTKLSALQVQQQLAIQALSIANQGSQNILVLFRN